MDSEEIKDLETQTETDDSKEEKTEYPVPKWEMVRDVDDEDWDF